MGGICFAPGRTLAGVSYPRYGDGHLGDQSNMTSANFLSTNTGQVHVLISAFEVPHSSHPLLTSYVSECSLVRDGGLAAAEDDVQERVQLQTVPVRMTRGERVVHRNP